MKRRSVPARADLTFHGIGRIAKAHGATSRAEYDRRVAILRELYLAGRWDVLEAVRDDRFSLPTVVAAYRAQRLDRLLADLVLSDPLAPAVARWLPTSAKTQATRTRYRVSWRALERAAVLPPAAAIRDLARLDWPALRERWPGGKHDWKHLRGGVSRFLTVQLGQDHPFRKAVLAEIPRPGRIPGRVPDLTPEVFWQIVQALPEHVRAAPVAILATGMRPGEFVACREEHKLPITKQVRVPGTKTEASAAVVPVDPDLWAWVDRAIPCPVGYWRLNELWRRARATVGVTVTLHDLRHCHGQWLVAAGRPLTAVQTSLRHTSDRMTRLYVEQVERGENAKAIAAILSATGPHGSAHGRESREGQSA